jgi:hypothetical protein
MEDQMNDKLSHASNQVGFYMASIAMPIGALLNIFAIYIFTRPNLNKTNMGFLFIWQKAIDTSLLFSYTFIFRAPILFDFDPFAASNVACKLLSFYKRFMLVMSSAIMVFIAFDRFLFVHYHKRFKFMKRKRNLMLIIGVMALSVAVLTLDNLFFYVEEVSVVKSFFNSTLNLTEQITSTKLTCTSSLVVSILSDFLLVSLRVYLPIMLILIFNIILIKDLVKSKNRVKFKIHKKEIQFTFTVIFSSFVFFGLYFPVSVVVLLKNVFLFTSIEHSKEIFDFCHYISIEISTIYLVIEFFVLLAVNKIFRKECVLIFRKLKHKLSQSDSDVSAIQSGVASLANSATRL